MLKKRLFICFSLAYSSYQAQVDSSATLSNLTTKKEIRQQVNTSEPLAFGEVFKPKVSLGTGMLSFHGDLYAKHFQAPWTARIGYDLTISQQLTKSLQLNFNVLFGKLGANEWLNNRQENFESEIRTGGVSLLYDFGNLIPDQYRVRPWVSLGINSFEFLSKTDLYDKNGNKYYYWSDGSIKNIDEYAPNASGAVNLRRDYYYETDIRELNKDGFGKYQERAWAFPIGIGAFMNITDRFDLKLGLQYYVTTTDYIDGITKNSLGTRSGTTPKDRFLYTSFALQYDLVLKNKPDTDTLPADYFKDIDWLALDQGDGDEDGVKDQEDKCPDTPKGLKVDKWGCQLDDDQDGVPNESDEELETPSGMAVNRNGVGLDDAYWQNWYNQYMDSVGDVKTEIIQNEYAVKKNTADSSNNALKNDQLYTVELARYTGAVPNDEMAKLLSIGDVKSTILPDNSTVLYTAGSYKEIVNAVKRRDELISEGHPKARVGQFKNNDLVVLTEEEISRLMAGATASTSTINNTNKAADAIANEFAKGDVVYRVQLGAYKHKISKSVFKNVGSVVELTTDAGLNVYATKGFKTIEGAAALKADLVVEGYKDAFITAYKNGKRIPLSETKATMQTDEKENVEDIPSFSSIDKSLVSFKVQLGALRKAGSLNMEEKIKDISEVEKQTTGLGMIRYLTGSFSSYAEAEKYRQELANKGFTEAFVIAIFKGDIISIQEAEELLK